MIKLAQSANFITDKTSHALQSTHHLSYQRARKSAGLRLVRRTLRTALTPPNPPLPMLALLSEGPPEGLGEGGEDLMQHACVYNVLISPLEHFG